MTSPIASAPDSLLNPELPDLPPDMARCLSIDLELSIRDNTLYAIAGYRPDSGDSLHYTGLPSPQQWERMEEIADNAHFLLGHNLIAFDAPHLEAINPQFTALLLPRVDTLMLNPLAFPRNPYHHLVKHYKDGALLRQRANDPLLDSQIAVQAFANQIAELTKAPADLLTAFHWLTTQNHAAGFDMVFHHIRGAAAPSQEEAGETIARLLQDNGCIQATQLIAENPGGHPWPLAYILAWLPAAGGNSVISPWAFHRYPETAAMLKQLRDTPCQLPECEWCRTRHDPRAQLQRWFGYDFRPEPQSPNGQSMQEEITSLAMAGQPVLGILPTGAGKSVCYQVPALSKYDATGALTVVISPLVALMADQVSSLENKGIVSASTLNGLLSMPERKETIERIRRGDTSMILVSPEQLRSPTFAKSLEHRQIAAWVLDEAHCLSKWGHDFRPDYRYIGKFIKKHHQSDIPPILCLTATAKPEVKEEITEYFSNTLGLQLNTIDGGATRTNLDFRVIATTPQQKLSHLYDTITTHLDPGDESSAIVYCSSRRNAEETSEYLNQQGLRAAFFHAGLPAEVKKQVQADFNEGSTQIIVATNAFGMGIDKPNVRLVVHRDVPGSLENYLQEAGRAGRDSQQAHCVLLYHNDDVERQHTISAGNRLSHTEINAALKAMRKLDKRRHPHGNAHLVATAGEILQHDDEHEIHINPFTSQQTKVAAAIAWLEEAETLERLDNAVTVFPSSLKVQSLSRVHELTKSVPQPFRSQLTQIVRVVMNTPQSQGISTDELSTVTGLDIKGLRSALNSLAALGILSDDSVITAYVRQSVANHSKKRFQQASVLERDLVQMMQESAPDQEKNERQTLHLRHTTQALKNKGHEPLLPLTVQRTLKGIAATGRNGHASTGNLRLRNTRQETTEVTLLSDWRTVQNSTEERRRAAAKVLDHLLSKLPANVSGADIPVETTMGQLTGALRSDLFHDQQEDTETILHQSLIWMHDQDVIRLNQGMTIIRPAMTIKLGPKKARFTNTDFQPLSLHYNEQTLQIHIIAEYAETGLRSLADAIRLATDYFHLTKEEFLKKWLKQSHSELQRQTTPQSWNRIVESLRNRTQQALVASASRRTNKLILAGPGSGKTTMLVHRIAYLIRIMREGPRSIIALAYNRHAATQIRNKLRELVGSDANQVSVLTCHGMAMRLAGTTFDNHAERTDSAARDIFDNILIEAAELLEGSREATNEPDEQRDRLLAGYRWILVDEYQDIRELEYRLISALAGRTQQDPEAKLNLLAVGDDDQNIYSFNGASTKFIKNFQEDYRAKPAYLTENYRSTTHIIDAANAVIAPAGSRLKTDQPIRIDTARRRQPAGGEWTSIDPVAQGRVQILPAGDSPKAQALLTIQELQRLEKLDPQWKWSNCAVIARNWNSLDPVRTLCTALDIPVQMAREDFTATWHLRETQNLLKHARTLPSLFTASQLVDWQSSQAKNAYTPLLREALAEYQAETQNEFLSYSHFAEWLAERIRNQQRSQSGLLLTSAHRAKGLEFDHVMILDQNWGTASGNEDPDAQRRLYYVAMTRAKKTLTLARMDNSGNPFLRLLDGHQAALTRHKLDRIPDAPPDMDCIYQRASLRDVNLSYPGRQAGNRPIHAAIAALQPGDKLQAQKGQYGNLMLKASSGVTIGETSKAFKPASDELPEATVLAVAKWSKEKSEIQYRNRLLCDEWEVIIPEFVFPARR